MHDASAQERRWLRWAHQACVVLAVLAVIAAMYFAKAAVAPVLFAVVFALLLSPAVDWLRRLRVPRALGSALVLLALVTALGASANAVWDPARDWLDKAPATMQTLERKLRPVTRFIAKVESVSDQAGQIATPTQPVNAEMSATPVPRRSTSLVVSTQHWVISIVTTLMVTYFLLATGPALLARWSSDPHTDTGDRRLLRLAETVRMELGRYFGAVTLSNAFLGIFTALAMYALDMPNPLLWGAMAFTLNFVPYAGSAVTLVLLTIVALVSFDGVAKAVAVAGAYLFLTTFEGQVLQPILVGRRLDVSPLFVVLGLWFGGWLWGIAGVALAVPVMVGIKSLINAKERYAVDEELPPTEEQQETIANRARSWATRSPRRQASNAREGMAPRDRSRGMP